MGIWGNPAAAKNFFLLILGGAPAPGAPLPAYATGWKTCSVAGVQSTGPVLRDVGRCSL